MTSLRPPGAQDMSHRGEGKASQLSHNLSVSLSNYYSAKNLKLTQVEHACSSTKTMIWNNGGKTWKSSKKCHNVIQIGNIAVLVHPPRRNTNGGIKQRSWPQLRRVRATLKAFACGWHCCMYYQWLEACLFRIPHLFQKKGIAEGKDTLL